MKNLQLKQIIAFSEIFLHSHAKFILFSSTFFANPHQHICKKPMLNQQLILQKS